MKIITRIPPYLLYLMISLSVFTESIYSMALPSIAINLNTYGGLAQSSTTAYYIGFSLGILTLGRASDLYGRRTVILCGIGFYIFATYLISITTDIKYFILCRFMQAYGASVGSVVSQAMARDCYKGWELSGIYANIAIFISLVPTTGAILGGYIIQYYHEWQNIFRFLILVSSLFLALFIKFLPETNANIGNHANNDLRSVVRSILKDGNFLRYAVIIGIVNAMYYSFIIQAPFIFIEHLSMQASAYGKLFIVITISSLIGCYFVKIMLKRYIAVERIRIIGFAISIFGIFLLMFAAFWLEGQTNVNYYVPGIFLPASFLFIGYNMIVPMILCGVLDNYQKHLGTAGSVFGFCYYMVTALISLLISIMHSNKINNYCYIFALLLIFSLFLLYQTREKR